MAAPPGKSTTGLDGSIAGALAYLLGPVSGIVLLAIERDSRFVRFHAMQSTMLFLIVAVVSMVCLSIPFVGWILYIALIVVTAALWLVLMYKALNGQWYKVPYIGELADQQVK